MGWQVCSNNQMQMQIKVTTKQLGRAFMARWRATVSALPSGSLSDQEPPAGCSPRELSQSAEHRGIDRGNRPWWLRPQRPGWCKYLVFSIFCFEFILSCLFHFLFWIYSLSFFSFTLCFEFTLSVVFFIFCWFCLWGHPWKNCSEQSPQNANSRCKSLC